MMETGTDTKTELRRGISEEIQIWLVRRRSNPTKLAQQLGWSQSYMSRRMVGDQAFDSDDLEAIAEALDVDVVDLLPPRRRGRPTAGLIERYPALDHLERPPAVTIIPDLPALIAASRTVDRPPLTRAVEQTRPVPRQTVTASLPAMA